MPFQLIIAPAGLPAAQALKRKAVRTFTADTVTLGGPDADCPLEGCTGTAAIIRHVPADRVYRLTRTGADDEHILRSGDAFTVGPWELHIHILHRKAAQSWQSASLAVLSKLGIAGVFIAIAVAMFWLPGYFEHTSSWNRYARLEELILRIDRIRNTLRESDRGDAPDLTSKLLIEQLKTDLNARIRYVRQYDRRLTSDQIARMNRALDDFEDLLQPILNKEPFPPLPKPDLDRAVRAILATPLPGAPASLSSPAPAHPL